MPNPTDEQQYEMALSSTLLFNTVFSLIIIIIFPILRRFFVSIFSPQWHLPRVNTGFSGYIFWFVDVFRQPLSVYATRGNVATILATFQIMLLALYLFISLISVTMLIPVYYNGTDISWNINYLTTWSKITMAHLEEGSIMTLVPIIALVLITYATMFFYKQFTIVYVFFRQRCLHRVIPQNFVVLLSNLPDTIDSKMEIETVLKPISKGVRAIIPVPKQCNTLTGLYEEIQDMEGQMDESFINLQDIKAQLMYQEVKRDETKERMNKTFDRKEFAKLEKKHKSYTKKSEKLEAKREECQEEFSEAVAKLRELRIEVVKNCYEDHVELDYIEYATNFPPEMPSIVQKSFEYLNKRTRTLPALQYPVSEKVEKYMSYIKSKVDNNVFDNEVERAKQHMTGSSVFLVCESQAVAAEKYTALVAQNSTEPFAMMAPGPNEINWNNMAIPTRRRVWRKIFFVLSIIVLFIAFIYGQGLIINILNGVQDSWRISFFKFFCETSTCKQDEEMEGFCSLCDSFSNMLVSVLPMIVNVILNCALPPLTGLCVNILGMPSESQAMDTRFSIMFYMLILIMGIIQITIPQMIDLDNGSFQFDFLQNYSLDDFIQSLGRNVIDKQFTFITYIINSYYTFPVMSLLNWKTMWNWLKAFLFEKNSLSYNSRLKVKGYEYDEQLSSYAHMFVIGFIFTIIAPVTNIILLVTMLMTTLIDRFQLLYFCAPTASSDFSAQQNLLVTLIGTIFMGLVFMLLSTCCFFLIQSGGIYTFGVLVIILVFIWALTYKNDIDKQYRRALTELARGDYQETANITINPAHIDSKYDDKDDYESRYDLLNKKQAQKAFKLLGTRNYKMSWRDKLLAKVYIDLSQLPISLVVFDGYDEEAERTCVILPKDNQIQNYELFKTDKDVKIVMKDQDEIYDLNEDAENTEDKLVKKTIYTDRQQDEIDIMVTYTHPAIQNAISSLQE